MAALEKYFHIHILYIKMCQSLKDFLKSDKMDQIFFFIWELSFPSLLF